MPKSMAMKKTNAGARDCSDDVGEDNGVDSNAHNGDCVMVTVALLSLAIIKTVAHTLLADVTNSFL